MFNPFNPDTIKVDHLPEVVWAKALNKQGLLAPKSESSVGFHVSNDLDGDQTYSYLVSALSDYGLADALGHSRETLFQSECKADEKYSLFRGATWLGGVPSLALPAIAGGISWELLSHGLRLANGELTKGEQTALTVKAEKTCKENLVTAVNKDVNEAVNAVLVSGDFGKGIAVNLSGEQLSKSYKTCVQQETSRLSAPDASHLPLLMGLGTGVISLAFGVAAISHIVAKYDGARKAKADVTIAQGNVDLVEKECQQRPLQMRDPALMA